MADYSRDTFRLTNVLHQFVDGAAVDSPRHYVGVRLQQAVPVLDADWNELEDIRRLETQAHLSRFFGDGVPSGDRGFEIGPVTVDNSFTINPGMALIQGMLVFNPHLDLTYADQETVLGVALDELAPPPAGIRDDLVYLDVWHQEVGSTGGAEADSRLTNPRIGVETCRRLERRWIVRLAPGVDAIDDVAEEPGHVHWPLAVLRRVEDQDLIQAHRITDLRRTDLNVARHLKIPVQVTRGGETVDSQRLADLLEALRTTLLGRLEGNLLFVDAAATDHDRTVVYFAVQHIAQVCAAGALQARTHNLNEADALQVLSSAYDAQDAFLTALADHGNQGDTLADDFISQYRTFLTGGTGVDGIEQPLAGGDLIGAYGGQQELNAWLAAPTELLPEGDLVVQYLSISPFENLVAGDSYEITVEFLSQVSSDQTSEEFDVTAALSSDLWSLDREADVITLDNEGGTGQLVFTVTPHAANNLSTFEVVATARRNPEAHSSPNVLALEIGQTPAVAATLLYAGADLNEADQLELSAVLLNAGLAGVTFALNNRTDGDRTYTLNFSLTAQSAERTGEIGVFVAAGSTQTRVINFGAPDGVTIAAGDTGTITVRLDDPNLDPADQETIEIEFLAI